MGSMNKRKLAREYKLIKQIRSWYLLILAIIFLAVGTMGLRQNNLEMIKLRDAVAVADKENKDVEAALNNLREFIYGHMNADPSSGNLAINPPIQLRYRYEKLAAEEAKRIKAETGQVKKTAEKVCARRFPGGGFNSPRVACVVDYLRVNSVDANEIPSELYKFDFVSPRWSPDLAGISLLASGLFFGAFLLRLVVGWWYKKELSD